jgi:hypothetical protein
MECLVLVFAELKKRLGAGERPSISPEGKVAFAHGITIADAQRSQSDYEAARELGINLHMINDDKVNSFLEGMAINTTMGKDPVSKKDVIIRSAVPKYAAVFIARSSLIRTSMIDPIDAQIGMLETKDLLLEVQMSMSEEEFEGGGALMLDAVKLITDTAWLDAQGGRKAKLMKVSPKSYEVSFKEAKKGDNGGFNP